MKNVRNLKSVDGIYEKVMSFDLLEVDNPDEKSPIRLSYFDRINKIISEIQNTFPNKEEIRIGEFGCAQGNISLMLAELGYTTFAFDINKTFLEYSEMKYENGDIQWILANIDDLPVKKETFDVIILGEVIEHCAYPEDIIVTILTSLRPGGLIIVTTPNGSKIGNKLPTFKQIVTRDDVVSRQFGPDGDFHLFLFELNEISDIIPSNSNIIKQGYLGGTMIINSILFRFQILTLFPVRFFEILIKILSCIPYVNKKTFSNIYLIIKKIEG